MTLSLWIIGAIAVVWPLLIMNWLREICAFSFSYWTGRDLTTTRSLEQTNDRIATLKQAVEGQDKLIAALWDKVYGYQAAENEYFICSWDLHPNSAHGVSPSWTLKVYEDDSLGSRLSRSEDHPLGPDW